MSTILRCPRIKRKGSARFAEVKTPFINALRLNLWFIDTGSPVVIETIKSPDNVLPGSSKVRIKFQEFKRMNFPIKRTISANICRSMTSRNEDSESEPRAAARAFSQAVCHGYSFRTALCMLLWIGRMSQPK